MLKSVNSCFSLIIMGFMFLAPPALACGGAQKVGELTFKKDNMSIKTQDAEVQFNIEIAESPSQLEHGLMHCTSLPADYAMLFYFADDTQHAMWMKDTPLSLDMLFVDSYGKIVYIQPNTTPQSLAKITPPAPVSVRAVLEMPAGTTAQKHIQVGDQVIHSYFKP